MKFSEQHLLQDLKERSVSVFVKALHQKISFETKIVGFQCDQDKEDARTFIELSPVVPYEHVSVFFNKNAEGTHHLNIGKMIYRSKSVRGNGSSLVFEVASGPDPRENSRKAERINFSSENRAFCFVHHPFDDVILQKKILDLSAHGLSFAGFFDSILFHKDVYLDKVTVSIPGRKEKTYSAVVKHHHTFLGLNGKIQKQIGVAFVPPRS